MSRDTYRDSRPLPPRERSPGRSYRPAGGGSYNPNFGSRPREFNSPYHDAPRGPRGVNDTPRGPSSAAPRGRGGFGGRTFEPRDSRDSRDPRDSRDDRLYEGGDRWNPGSRARSPPPRRDSQHLPRQLDTDRARQESRDGPPSAGSNPSDAGFRASGSSFRGNFTRGRGDAYRGDRSRVDDRPRPRSRDRSADSARLDYRERARNADERSYVRDRTDDRDSYTRRADPPNRLETRAQPESRGPPPQLTPQNERPAASHQAPPERVNGETRREFDSSRRGSALSDHIRDARREPERVDPNAGRPDSQRAPRPASPPPAVPSFGFRPPASFSGVTSLSWKNPDLTKQAPASGPAQTSKPAPTAPKALTAAVPPSAPRADRVLEKTPSKESLIAVVDESKEGGMSVGASPSPRLTSGVLADNSQQMRYSPSVHLNAPIGPRAMTSPQPTFGRPGVGGAFGRAASPPQVNASIPTGPKAAAINASPRPLPGAIPTGPRADRGPPPSGPRQHAPPNPKLFKTGSQTFTRPSLVPSKRDVDGFERDRSPSNDAQPGESTLKSLANGLSLPAAQTGQSSVKQEAIPTNAQQADVHMPDVPTADHNVSPSIGDDRGALHHFMDEDDDDLDLDDMAEVLEMHEMKFENDRKRLEAKRVDLSDDSMRPTLLFPEISRLVVMRAMVNDLSYRRPAERKEAPARSREPQREPVQAPPVILPPVPVQADEDQDHEMSDAYSSRESSLDRMSTPDLSEVPYLERPTTPLSAPDPFSTIKQEVPEDSIKHLLKEEIDGEAEEQRRLQHEFRQLYFEWKSKAMRHDRQKEEVEREAKQCSPESVSAVGASELLMPSLPTPTEGGRRAHRFASDYDLQRVMEMSLREEEEKKLKELAIKEAAVNIAADREADIPALLSPNEAKRRVFEDVSQARRPQDAVTFFEFVPPIDDFTEEEDRLMRDVYKETPKVWHDIAKVVRRTYKECINHYYASKWEKPYKSRVGGKRRTRGGKKPARGRSALVPAEDAETDSNGVAMVTESGRPRRAAAPIWPSKESDQEQGVVAATTGKRNGKTEAEAGTEKAGRRKAKEKAPKKTGRTQLLAARPTVSPQKADREIKDKLVQAMDLDDPWAMQRGGQLPEPMPVMRQSQLYPEGNLPLLRENADLAPVAGGPTERPRSHSNTTQRQGASSYWSVTEEQDFQRCLEYYGTDFQAISSHMGTKTQTMIKNHYQKFVNDGKHSDLIQRANEATVRRSRGEDMGPPPNPSQAVKRHGRFDTTAIPLPRSLAPNNEALEAEQSPPASVAVPFGLTPRFPPGSTLSQAGPRSSAGLTTSASGPRPTQTGPMMGIFKSDQPTPIQNNAIRPLIPPPDESTRPPRGPDRIKTEFRPAEHDRELLARHNHPDREHELMRRQADLEARRNEHIAAERRELERSLQRSHQAGHSAHPSMHGMSPTSEHVRQDSRSSLNLFGSTMASPNILGSRGPHADLAGLPQQGPNILERRAASPPRHASQPFFGHQAPPMPAAPSPTPTPAAAKEAPRRSNLMSLLNSEPEQEAPKRREPEPTSAPTHQHRIPTTGQNDTPPNAALARDSILDRPFSRPTYPPVGHSNSSMSTPTHESLPSGRDSLPPMSHRDSWPGRQPQNFAATNSPHLHAQHAPPVPDRVPLFASRDYRQSAFAGLNGPTRANPSPPPAGSAYQHHSRTPSYTHPQQHPTPPSSAPVVPNNPVSALHGGHFGQREARVPGVSPHLGPQHQPPPMSRTEFGHQRMQEPRDAMFDRFREREPDRDREAEAFDLITSRERERARHEREREHLALAQAQREREYAEHMAQAQRFGHHTPPVNQPRFAPPQAVPERNAGTPLSLGGYPPPRELHVQQQAMSQRQYEFEEEQRRRDYERERSRQSRIHQAADDAARIQMEAARRAQEQVYRRPDERFPGMPPR